MSRGNAPDRPDLFVVARILERLWREGGPMVPTRLQAAANVNYDVFTRYLTWLEERGLVERVGRDSGSDRIALTRRGAAAYRRLVEWLDEFVHGASDRKPGPP